MLTEDGSLISKCLNGEPEAFGILVDKYKSGIYAFVYNKLNDFRDAQDVTQDVFVEAFCKLHSLKRWESFAFWLYRIASNLCKRWIRTKIRHPEPEFIEDQNPLEIDSTAISSYRDEQMNQLIREAMDSLPEIYREILLLYYFGGMNSNEIARALGVSPTAILQRLTRARAQLKEDIIGMIGITFNEKKLGSGFTFHIVEAVKRLKISPVSTTKGLPWGLSLATGIMVAVLSFNPNVTQVNLFGNTTGSPLPVESKVLKIGEIPVDVVKTSEKTIISNKLGKADNGEPKKPDVQNAFMSPQAEGGIWANKNDMPTTKVFFSTSVVDGKIYTFGGSADEINGQTEVEEYDPANDKWEKKADMPTARVGFMTAVVSGKIYVIGDYLRDSPVEEYDPKNDTWKKKGFMPRGRGSFGIAVVENKIYVIGGIRNGVNFVAEVDAYDPETDTWEIKKDMPLPTSNESACAINGKIYVMGCRVNFLVTDTVWEYDPQNDIWNHRANMPTKRMNFPVNEINGKIYAIGGDPLVENTALAKVEVYDPQKDEWKTEKDMPNPRMWFCANVINNKIYVIGGSQVYPFKPLSSVEEYTPEGWSISPQGKLPNTWGKIKAK